MMRSVFSGVSGLKNHQTRMDVIGNNISNVNTTGFKSSRVTFADTLNQTMSGASAATENLGGTNPKQVGLGSSIASIDLLFNDGTVQSTGKNTDLCLSGNGLFVVKDGEQTYYTRNGAFEFDAEGNYVLPGSGLKVQGWNATDGVLNTSDAPTSIVVPAGKSMAAEETILAKYANNIDSAAETIKEIAGGASLQFATTDAQMTLKVGANEYKITDGTLNNKEVYTIVSDVAAGASTITLSDSSGAIKILTIDPASATDVIAAGTTIDTSVTTPDDVLTGGTELKTKTASDTNKAKINSLFVTNGIFKNNLSYGMEAVKKGDTTVTVTDSAGGTQTLTLAAAATADVDAVNVTTAPIKYSNITGGNAEQTPLAASKNNPITLTLSDKDATKVVQTSGTYTDGYGLPTTTTLTIYDSLGNTHSLPVYFTKSLIDSHNGNMWTVSLNTDGSGTVVLKEDDGSYTTVTMADLYLQFSTTGRYTYGTSKSTLTLSNGANLTQNVTLDVSSLTQFAGNNTVNGTTDGHKAGILESIAIDASGTIVGTYTNGVRQAEAQVAVAQFTNASGLTKTGDSLYQTSSNSGVANVKTATDLGVKITASALEMSNVDIANEFADMIITQRGFQSNSKMITVGDEMLETVINMKR